MEANKEKSKLLIEQKFILGNPKRRNTIQRLEGIQGKQKNKVCTIIIHSHNYKIKTLVATTLKRMYVKLSH